MSENNESGWLNSIKNLLSRGEESHEVSTSDSLLADVIAEIESAAPEVPAVVNKRAKISIAVLSGKGGVGKTTTLLGLAGAAESEGKNVLLIDLDPQGSLTLAALDRPNSLTALNAFHGSPLSTLAVPAVWKEFRGQIDIVPASRALAQVESFIDPKVAVARLTNALGDLSGYDVVLVDAPATLSALTLEAVALASTVVVVAEPTLFSLRSASDAIEFALAARRSKTGWTRKVHVVLNKLDNSEESLYRAREIKRLFPKLVLKSTISASAAINDASGAGLPVHSMPGAKARNSAAEFDALFEELTTN